MMTVISCEFVERLGRSLSDRLLLVIALLLRLAWLGVGLCLDNVSHGWKYTDADYSIFCDAADFVAQGLSPYERVTYRYSPLLATLLHLLSPTPAWHNVSGKLLFLVCDALIVPELLRIGHLRSHPLGSIVGRSNHREDCAVGGGRWWAVVWALNPISAYIATRGSMDSISNYLVLLTLRLLLESESQSMQTQKRLAMSAGAAYGLAVHLRLYPVIYLPVLATYLWQPLSPRNDSQIYSNSNVNSNHDPQRLFPFLLAASTACLAGTAAAVQGYGASFLHHGLLYHLTRTDHRHNFSLYFYSIYLSKSASLSSLSTTSSLSLVAAKWLPFFCQAIAMAVVVRRFVARNWLFCLFLETLVFVAFNKVVTGQYFLWFVVLLPVAFPQPFFQRLCSNHSNNNLLQRKSLWIWTSAVSLWLFSAWLLEMNGISFFSFIFAASVLLLFANVLVVQSLAAEYLSWSTTQKPDQRIDNPIIN
jgi:GPI mannosyltransferase 1 subunit M